MFGTCAAGAVVLTVNVVLLGGNIGFFQSMCLLGYCLFPMDVAAIITALTTNMIARWIVVLVRPPSPLCSAMQDDHMLKTISCSSKSACLRRGGTPCCALKTASHARMRLKPCAVSCSREWARLQIGLAWASWASVPFIGGSVSPARRALAVYPLLLLYVAMGWLALIKG